MARYTKDENGNLILTAGGTRTWIVTQAAHDRAVSAGTAPNNCLVAITDDYSDGGWTQLVNADVASSSTGTFEIPDTANEVLIILRSPYYSWTHILPYSWLQNNNFVTYNTEASGTQVWEGVIRKDRYETARVIQNGTASTGNLTIYYR